MLREFAAERLHRSARRAQPLVARPRGALVHTLRGCARQAARGGRGDRPRDQKRVVELGYALSILGNPDGSSFVAGGGPPDPAHAYEFDPSKHVDFKMLKQLRATSALLIESSTPEEELQRWLLHSKVRTAPVCS